MQISQWPFFWGLKANNFKKLITFSEQFQTFYGISQLFCFLLLSQYPHCFLLRDLHSFRASPALLLPDTFLLSRLLPVRRDRQCLSLLRPSLGTSSSHFYSWHGWDNLVQLVVDHSKASLLYRMSLFPTGCSKIALRRWWPSSLPTTPIWYQKLLLGACGTINWKCLLLSDSPTYQSYSLGRSQHPPWTTLAFTNESAITAQIWLVWLGKFSIISLLQLSDSKKSDNSFLYF